MSDGGNPLGALVSFWMLLKLIGVLASLMGGIYALYCLNRIALGAHRIAEALETSAQNQAAWQTAQTTAQPERAAQPFAPTMPQNVGNQSVAAPLSNVPPEKESSTRSPASPPPSFTEHDVRPRSDSF